MPSRCLADFVQTPEEGLDYVGMFAVTAGIGAEHRAAAFEAAHDDYNAIMLKALADRPSRSVCRIAAHQNPHRFMGLRAE